MLLVDTQSTHIYSNAFTLVSLSFCLSNVLICCILTFKGLGVTAKAAQAFRRCAPRSDNVTQYERANTRLILRLVLAGSFRLRSCYPILNAKAFALLRSAHKTLLPSTKSD
ncbi:hypothetical protein OEA42_004017 [Vibrio parahaemolyticus]|nr:hypothetical protein [Vibrio parahaemolyticus]